jgi:hypothetical protein
MRVHLKAAEPPDLAALNRIMDHILGLCRAISGT